MLVNARINLVQDLVVMDGAALGGLGLLEDIFVEGSLLRLVLSVTVRGVGGIGGGIGGGGCLLVLRGIASHLLCLVHEGSHFGMSDEVLSVSG